MNYELKTNSLVAQRLAHRPVTAGVAGSSPVRTAKTHAFEAQQVERLTVNQRAAGSNPA